MKKELEFEAVTIEEVTQPNRTALLRSVEAFLQGDADYVRVLWRGRYVSAKSCAVALHVCIKRARHDALVSVRSTPNDVFLVKKHKTN